MLENCMPSVCRRHRVLKLLRRPAAAATPTSSDEQHLHLSRRSTDSADQQNKRLVRAILAQLDVAALKSLCDAVESGGRTFGSCVPAPASSSSSDLGCEKSSVCCWSPLRHMCRYFRWPLLAQQDTLVCLPVCQSGRGENVHCVNPFHWALESHFTTSQSRQQHLQSGSLHQECSGDSGGKVTTSAGNQREARATAKRDLEEKSSDDDSGDIWCRLFYYERRALVGGDWPVRYRWQHVFHDLPSCSGLCLAAAAASACVKSRRHCCDLEAALVHHSPADCDVRERCIGAGFTIWRQRSVGVYLYNRHERPLFISAATGCHDNGACAQSTCVYRLEPGCCAVVLSARTSGSQSSDKWRCITVSFSKGWGWAGGCRGGGSEGSRYKRSSVLECPCWMEVWLDDSVMGRA